jgi:hypothetical protein
MSNPIIPLNSEQTAKKENKVAKEGYIKHLLVGFDHLLNVISGGLPDETISSRAARADLKGKVWGRVMSRFLDLFEKDHGSVAQAGDVARAKSVIKLEKNSKGDSDGN